MPDMKSVAFFLIHLLVLFAKSLKSAGIKAMIAENLMLKQQLIVLSRARRKAPNLQTSDRFLLGALSLLVSPRRLFTVAIIIKPSTLLKFHRALVNRKYRRYGCPRIAYIITPFQDLIHPATSVAITIRSSDWIDGEQTCASWTLRKSIPYHTSPCRIRSLNAEV